MGRSDEVKRRAGGKRKINNIRRSLHQIGASAPNSDEVRADGPALRAEPVRALNGAVSIQSRIQQPAFDVRAATPSGTSFSPRRGRGAGCRSVFGGVDAEVVGILQFDRHQLAVLLERRADVAGAGDRYVVEHDHFVLALARG